MKRKAESPLTDPPTCPFLQPSNATPTNSTEHAVPEAATVVEIPLTTLIVSTTSEEIQSSSEMVEEVQVGEGESGMMKEEKDEEGDEDEDDKNELWTSREFDVLDEFEDVNSSDDDYDQQSDDSYDSDVPDEEIEAMLEEGLPEEFKGNKKSRGGSSSTEEKKNPKSRGIQEREKVVLDEKGRNHFEVLPEGWVSVTHNSGMPVYLHKKSRVCTLTMPYFLGPGSARKHEIPLSSVPCLQYRKAKEKESELWREHEEQVAQAANGENSIQPTIPSARIETMQENRAAQSLTSAQFREYCERLFTFKSIKVMRFPSWSARRKYTKLKRYQRQQLQRPSLPDGTKLITFPIRAPIGGDSGEGTEPGMKGKKEWVMNPTGKSYVCILHEYVQHALKKQPSYVFKELENAATPYSATVIINEMQYGQGFGTSKKQAKSEAAKATLEILIPEMRDKIKQDVKRYGGKPARKDLEDLSFFDEIKIEDPRVTELCNRTCEPSPYSILLVCLQRNFGLGNIEVKYDVNSSRHQRNEYTMTVGKHTVKVICKNKRDGKQQASQAILQALHPHVGSWGSLLRMYGSRSVKSVREKKQEEQEITLLQNKAAVNSPNFAILDKLKSEMLGLHDKKAAIQPIGKFIPPAHIGLPSSTGADLNNVDI